MASEILTGLRVHRIFTTLGHYWISMKMLGEIRRMHLPGKVSLHEIAKRTGLSRNTVRALFAKIKLSLSVIFARFLSDTTHPAGLSPRPARRTLFSKSPRPLLRVVAEVDGFEQVVG